MSERTPFHEYRSPTHWAYPVHEGDDFEELHRYLSQYHVTEALRQLQTRQPHPPLAYDMEVRPVVDRAANTIVFGIAFYALESEKSHEPKNVRDTLHRDGISAGCTQ